MFLNNYKLQITSFFSHSSVNFTNLLGNTIKTPATYMHFPWFDYNLAFAGDYHGGYTSNTGSISADAYKYFWNSQSGIPFLNPRNFKCLVIGSGDTPVTPSDYTLAKPLIFDGQFASQTEYSTNDDGYQEISVTSLVHNNSEYSIKISEIGIISPRIASSSSLYMKDCILIERTLLDAPIVVDSNTSASFVYRIRSKITINDAK